MHRMCGRAGAAMCVSVKLVWSLGGTARGACSTSPQRWGWIATVGDRATTDGVRLGVGDSELRWTNVRTCDEGRIGALQADERLWVPNRCTTRSWRVCTCRLCLPCLRPRGHIGATFQRRLWRLLRHVATPDDLRISDDGCSLQLRLDGLFFAGSRLFGVRGSLRRCCNSRRVASKAVVVGGAASPEACGRAPPLQFPGSKYADRLFRLRHSDAPPPSCLRNDAVHGCGSTRCTREPAPSMGSRCGQRRQWRTSISHPWHRAPRSKRPAKKCMAAHVNLWPLLQPDALVVPHVCARWHLARVEAKCKSDCQQSARLGWYHVRVMYAEGGQPTCVDAAAKPALPLRPCIIHLPPSTMMLSRRARRPGPGITTC